MGKLIVLEGIDGSGKSTQYRNVCSALQRDGYDFYHIVFPRYKKESSSLIRMYLGGQFGTNPNDVNAYTASTFFAVDRFASYKDDWGEKYNSGELILSDRYTTSNAVHQGSKLSDEEMPDFFSWLYDLEYKKMQLPAPDLVVYLDTTLDLSLKRIHRREAKTGNPTDIHEADSTYLSRCLHAADLACEFFGWKRIPCFDLQGNERDAIEKSEEIYSLIRDFIG